MPVGQMLAAAVEPVGGGAGAVAVVATVGAMLLASQGSAPPARLPWPTAGGHGADDDPDARALRSVRRRRLILAVASVIAVFAVVSGQVRYAVWAALAAFLAWGLEALLRRRSASRAAQRRRTHVLATCDLLAAELRAGRPPTSALQAAHREWDELASVVRADLLGADVASAWQLLGARDGAGDLRLVAAAWRVSERTGAQMAPALDRVVVLIRAGEATRRTVASELASARATARLMAALPLVALLIGKTTGGDPIAFLLHSPVGLACLAGGLLLGGLGLAWIERIADDVMGAR